MELWHGAMIRNQRILINELKEENRVMKETLVKCGFGGIDELFNHSLEKKHLDHIIETVKIFYK